MDNYGSLVLSLARYCFLTDCTLGVLKTPFGVVYTLERNYGSQPKIPINGVYSCHWKYSTKFCAQRLYIDVEGHQGIMFHEGNSPRDSSGCVLVGMGCSSLNTLTDSKTAVKLLDKMRSLTTGDSRTYSSIILRVFSAFDNQLFG